MQEQSAQSLIHTLQLELHPLEGGYFRRVYESELTIETNSGTRKTATAIYYLLTKDSPIGFMHRNQSDIIHCHHFGGAIRYTLLNEFNEVEHTLLGNKLTQGQAPQLLVKGRIWKAAELIEGEFALITELVSPGFVYEDNEIADVDSIRLLVPDQVSTLKHLIAKV